MLRKLRLAILLVVITLPVWALTEARLLNQSSSGHTVLFNLGVHDGMKEGDYAVVLKQIRSLELNDLKIVPVGKARNIKLFPQSSVWILYQIYDQELLVKGDKFLVLSESHMLSGKRPPKLGRITMVAPKGAIKERTKDLLNDDADRLSKLKDKYQTIAPTHETTAGTDSDADLVDLQTWNTAGKNSHPSFLYKSPHKDEFNRQLRLATFEKLVTAYVNKVNDPDFNYDRFYEQQRKEAFMNEFKVNTNYDSEYNKFLRKEARMATADAKLFRSILEKGESWSEEYSDEELKIVLTQVSELQEKDRRLYVMVKPTRFAWAIDYGHYLTDDQTENDAGYRRDSRYSTEADFEVTPFLKHSTLERFTLNGSFRLNYTAFEAESYNAAFNEYSVTAGANWYPWHPPYAVESPVFFLGTYLRSGFGKATVPTVNQKANYTVLTMPGFRGGMKYYLKNNWGLRLLMSLETIQLDRYEFSTYDSILPERTNLLEAKVGIGLTHAF